MGCRGKAVHDHTGLIIGCLGGEANEGQERGLGNLGGTRAVNRGVRG